jgi:hypothetical protein
MLSTAASAIIPLVSGYRAATPPDGVALRNSIVVLPATRPPHRAARVSKRLSGSTTNRSRSRHCGACPRPIDSSEPGCLDATTAVNEASSKTTCDKAVATPTDNSYSHLISCFILIGLLLMLSSVSELAVGGFDGAAPCLPTAHGPKSTMPLHLE